MVLGVPTPTLLVFLLILVTVVLFVTERLPPDITAMGALVALVLLGPWTSIGPEQALSGFSNAATITILAMYILSRGVQDTGIVKRLGFAVAKVTKRSENRLLAVVVGITAPLAGVINNTPVVAVFIPMVTDLAEDANVSPSKVLLPLSYAAMLGGTLTLVGTGTNLVASDLSARLIDHPFSMFEFTALGVIVVGVGGAYLLTVGRVLTPSRIPPGDRTTGYGIDDYLTRVLVTQRSPLVGVPASEVAADGRRDLDIDVLDVVRGDTHFIAADSDRLVEARDVLTIRGNPERIRQLVSLAQLRLLPRAEVTDEELDRPQRSALVELVVPSKSAVVGETVENTRLRERYDATVLAIRRPGGELVRDDIGATQLESGDSLLLQTTEETAHYLAESPAFVVISELPDGIEQAIELSPKTPIALGIVASVILLAALDVVPIVISALGGVVAMIVTDVLSANDAYDAVNWNVIFLLAGVIPLGIALQETGGATLVADFVVSSAGVLPAAVVLGLFYLLTGLLANLITPVASVVLFLPIAVTTAQRMGVEAFPFVLAVTFAASTAFMTPMGYQTNLMVYGPGGYRFTDYVRVGAPLQLLLAVVTTAGIVLLWTL
ncbi:MAG: SLC13 family permease [Halobacteriota archaeon]